MAPEPIRAHGEVPVAPATAFAAFAERLGDWWPPEYTWSRDVLEDIAIEPGVGGHCVERGPQGFTCHWGRVLVWEPPRRLVFAWQIAPDRTPAPDPATASEVEVRFEDPGRGGTEVVLEHRGFERHGDGGADYRAALGSEGGWPYMFGRYLLSAASRS